MNIRKVMYDIYFKIESIITPTLKYPKYFYEDTINKYVNNNTCWLDLGCGHHILPVWRFEEEQNIVKKCRKIIGIDYDLHSLKKHKSIFLKVRGDIVQLPFKSDIFDMITTNMVIEHVSNTDNLFKEMQRILKPGGVFILHTPNEYGYTTILARLVPDFMKNILISILEGRKEEDVFDTYYRANTRKRIHSLATTNNLSVVNIRMLVSSAELVVIPPLVIFELLWIKILMTKLFKPFRTNIIAIVMKEGIEQ